MWMKVGSRYFNTDAIAYVQVASEEGQPMPKAVYIHFLNESHTFTMHGEDAATVLRELSAITQNMEVGAAVVGRSSG